MQLHTLLIYLIALLPTPGYAQGPTEDVEPPVANRKEPFSGAVGRKFTVVTRAEPLALQVGDTLTFTVQVEAEGAWQRPPQRPDLRRHKEYASFAKQFHIENSTERHEQNSNLWEFDYLLRPLNDAVTAIPRLPFVYYRPKSGYQTISAPSIKVTVRSRPEVTPTQVQGSTDPIQLPERLYEFAEGSQVLRRDDATFLPPSPLLPLFLLAIPLLCVCWYVAWQRLYPEAARLVQMRRSRAARTALHAIQRLTRTTDVEQVRQVSVILTNYVRERFDLPTAEPTPVEITTHLRTVGIAPALAESVADIFRTCDAVRFAAIPPEDAQPWTKRVSDIIFALEAAPCSPPAC